MKNMVFGMSVRMLRLDEEVSPHHAEEAGLEAWTLGWAITHILRQPDHHRHEFRIETEDDWIDHLAALRLAESSLFQRWQAGHPDA
jgi:hypothetical protein